MDPEKAKQMIDGKATPPYPRLLFFGTRVLPLLFAAGALQIAWINYFHPMTEEEFQMIQDRRSGKGTLRTGTTKGAKGGSSATAPVLKNPHSDDTHLLRNEPAQPLDLSYLRVDQDDSCNVTRRGEHHTESNNQERQHNSSR